jgi:hypothetical protein
MTSVYQITKELEAGMVSRSILIILIHATVWKCRRLHKHAFVLQHEEVSLHQTAGFVLKEFGSRTTKANV